MCNEERIAVLRGKLAQANVRLAASRALRQEALENLAEARAERDHYRRLAAIGADTLISICQEPPPDTVMVPRAELLLAQYHLSHVMHVDAQDLAERFQTLLGEEEGHAG